MTTAPYGSWRSPITADLIVTAGIGLSQPRLHGDTTCWLEIRPTEGGRYVVVRRRADGTTEDVNAAPLNARTRVHEYGGGDYVVAGDGSVYLSNFPDQRLYVIRPGAEPQPLTEDAGGPVLRYADASLDPARGRLICVREDHRGEGSDTGPAEAKNTIVAVDTSSGAQAVLAEGSDFYAYPRVSPDGARLCWLAWDHPNMPWDSTELWVAELLPDGAPGERQRVAGGDGVSIFQPEWSPDGRLYYVSDATGWWNLYRWEASEASVSTQPVVAMEAEFGRPLWQFGASAYDFAGQDRIICAYLRDGLAQLASIDTATGALTDIPTPFNVIGNVRAGEGRVVFTAASATDSGGVYALDLATNGIEQLRASSSVKVDPGYVSTAQPVEFPTSPVPGEPDATAYGFFYPPRNADFEAPAGEKPPLVVMIHGGPTSATSPALSSRIQFWTSRGIAVLDVNYGGSTGYGRRYRERLNGRWGLVDVEDCVAGARYLVAQGLVDEARLAITGGSAGGYTTLAALAFHDTFKAGASHFGVSDLEALARDTHKFESRYLDGLIGPYPERRDLYVERSPIHHVEGLSVPAIFFQGLEDRIVPPNQAETMVEALRSKGVPVAYLPFEGEQHGFRRAENIKRALEGELYFYGRIFGFTPADEIEPVQIANL